MAVDVADEKPDRLEPGEREVVRADPRRRRVVLNGRVVVAADAALDAAEVRREIGKVSIKTSIFAKPFAFDKNGDVKGGIPF